MFCKFIIAGWFKPPPLLSSKARIRVNSQEVWGAESPDYERDVKHVDCIHNENVLQQWWAPPVLTAMIELWKGGRAPGVSRRPPTLLGTRTTVSSPRYALFVPLKNGQYYKIINDVLELR